jgi:mRNA interferase HigB
MDVIGKKRLEQFKKDHADIRGQVNAWINEAEGVQWQNPHEIKAKYSTATFIGDNRVVFNLKGTKYRLDVHVDYIRQMVIVKRIGTHAEYSKWKF